MSVLFCPAAGGALPMMVLMVFPVLPSTAPRSLSRPLVGEVLPAPVSGGGASVPVMSTEAVMLPVCLNHF